jgi:hypothetical protein
MASRSQGRDQPVHPEGVPLVSTTDRAGVLLGIPADQLGPAIAAAGLRPWGEHACGQPVWRWPELIAVARNLGVEPPAALDRDQRRRASPLQVRRERGRRNRYQTPSAERPGRQA